MWFSPVHLNLFFLKISPCLCGFLPLFSRWLAFLLVLSANAVGAHSCTQFYHKQFFYIVVFEEEDMLEIWFKICYLSLMRCILCGLFICAYWSKIFTMEFVNYIPCWFHLSDWVGLIL